MKHLMKQVRHVIFAAFSFLLAGQAVAADLMEVPIGISPVMSSAAMFIAVEKGYFEKQGIKPVVNPFKASGAKMMPFLASGQLLVAGGNINAGMYNAIANDIPIRLVADKGTVSPGHGYLALIVRKDLVDGGRYKDYKDLKGMRMAVTAKGVSQEIVTEMYLQKVGLGLDDITLNTLAYADINIALANKSLDASVQIEPFVAKAVAEGIAVRVQGNDAIYPDQQSAAIMYSPIFIEQHPDVAKRFMVAYVQGMRDYNDAFEKNKNREEIIQILMKHTSMKERATYDQVAPVGLHPDGALNRASLEADADWFYKHGYVDKQPDMDAIVDTSFIDYAREQLGDYK